jgi:predicted DCC family thiol-disulfide oxidoreductase YuxK
MEMMMTLKTGQLRAHRSRRLPARNGSLAPVSNPVGSGTRVREASAARRAKSWSGPLARLSQFWCGQADLAPLALFRIAYGAMLFGWFWQLLPNMTPFFTDEGMLPRSLLLTLHPLRFSLLNVGGELWQIWPFWLAGLLVAVMLMVGYRTRLASLLAFLLVISFQWRNPLILDGSDLVFRLVPFWMIFSAAGNRYSVDAALRRIRGQELSGSGPALPIRLLELQIAWIYLMTAVAKLSGAKWVDGSATYYALQLKHTFGRGYVEALAQNDIFTHLLTWGTLAAELPIFFLVFAPFWQGRARVLAIALAVPLHLGIMLMMNVGNFPGIMLVSLLLFLPATLAYRLVDHGRALFGRWRVTLYYDGACLLCRRTVAFLRAVDIYRTITLVDLRSVVDPAALEQRIQAYDERGRRSEGAAALARAARGLPLLCLPGLLLSLPGLSALAQRVYDWVARHRLLLLSCPDGVCTLDLGPKAEPSTTRPTAWLRWPRRIGYAVLAVIAAGALATALPPSVSAYKLPEPVGPAVQALVSYRAPEPFYRLLLFASLDQGWNMFAPDPMGADGWLLMPAKLADGSAIDLLTGAAPSEEPRYADPLYSRWAKVTERVVDGRNTVYRQEYGRMYCRLRNLHLQPGQSPIATFDVIYVQRFVPPLGQGGEPTLQRHQIWSHTC